MKRGWVREGKRARRQLKKRELYPLSGSDLCYFTFKGAFQEHISVVDWDSS